MKVINLKNIVLIGMSGVGKSTVGEYISNRLNKDLLDTDDIIISNTGKDIDYIFNNYGEKYFRELENLVVKSMSRKKGTVISTGGGIVLNPINIEKLKENGIIFFLKGSMETLYHNLNLTKSLGGQRPLLNNRDLKSSIEKIYKTRENLYIKGGDYTISVDNRTVAEIGDEIIEIFMEINPCS